MEIIAALVVFGGIVLIFGICLHAATRKPEPRRDSWIPTRRRNRL